MRAGDNLFSASIVAVDAKTGKYRWHFQQVHHDIWDYDAPSRSCCSTSRSAARTRKGLAQPSKTGWVYILDRTNGQPLIGIDERPVPQEPRQATAATQPYPRGDAFVPQSIAIAPEGFTLVNQGRIFTPFWTDAGADQARRWAGGANWPPSSYDPADRPSATCARQDRTGRSSGRTWTTKRPLDGEATSAASSAARRWRMIGVFAALDMRTNKLVWQQQWPEHCYSGSVVTAGGLAVRRPQRRAPHGARLTERHAALGVSDGRRHERARQRLRARRQQYVVAYSAGNMFAGHRAGDSVWLFGLDGTLEPARRSGTAMHVHPRSAAGRRISTTARRVYDTACGSATASRAKAVTTARKPRGDAQRRARHADRQRGPQRDAVVSGVLTAEQIRDVAAYVATMLPH